MAHVAKYTQNAIAGVERHCLRKNDNYGNQLIDTNKSHENYRLDSNSGNPIDHLNKRLEEVNRNKKRADIVVAANWVITQPRNVTPEESRKFFEETHNYLAKRYGEKNVIFSVVHMDETTPHLHFSFVPVTPDKKRGGEKLCAKEVLDQKELKRFHKDLSAHLQKEFGRDVGVETGHTKINLPLEKYKAIKAQEEVAKLEPMLDARRKELETLVKAREPASTAENVNRAFNDATKDASGVFNALKKWIGIPVDKHISKEDIRNHMKSVNAIGAENVRLNLENTQMRETVTKIAQQRENDRAAVEAANTVKNERDEARRELRAVERKLGEALEATGKLAVAMTVVQARDPELHAAAMREAGRQRPRGPTR